MTLEVPVRAGAGEISNALSELAREVDNGLLIQQVAGGIVG